MIEPINNEEQGGSVRTKLNAAISQLNGLPTFGSAAIANINQFDAAGTAANAVSTHVAQPNPHPQYEQSLTHNLTGGAAPGVNNDSTQGYSPRSLWFNVNVTPADVYICRVATAGAAVWVKLSLSLDELGTAATLDVPATGDAATDEVVKGDDTRLSNARPPTAHTHPIDQVNGLQSALDGKAPTEHTHTIEQVSGLQTALDGKRALTNNSFPTYTLGREDLAAVTNTSIPVDSDRCFRQSVGGNRNYSFSGNPGTEAFTLSLFLGSVNGTTPLSDYSFTWPSNIFWAGGVAPEFTGTQALIVLHFTGVEYIGNVGMQA